MPTQKVKNYIKRLVFKSVLCAEIIATNLNNDLGSFDVLKIGYKPEELDKLKEKYINLDLSQIGLNGYVWFKDGRWLEIVSSQGTLITPPEVPDDLKENLEP